MASVVNWTYKVQPFQKYQGKQQKDVIAVYDSFNSTLYTPVAAFGNWARFFAAPNTTDRYNDALFFEGRHLFLAEYEPSRSTEAFIAFPLEVRQRPGGTFRTIADVRDELGLYLGNVLTPADAVQSNPRVLGLLSDSDRVVLPTITVNKTLAFYQQTNLTAGFILRVKDSTGAFVEFGPFALSPGWNFPLVTIDGVRRGIPVFSDPASTPPSPW